MPNRHERRAAEARARAHSDKARADKKDLYLWTQTDQIYEFTTDTGELLYIASGRLRAWCLEQDAQGKLERLAWVMPKDFVPEISIERVQQLLKILPRNMFEWEPIILGEVSDNPPDAHIIDGRHRIFLAQKSGSTHIMAWILKPVQWQPFAFRELDDLQRATARQLAPKAKLVTSWVEE
jgi:hypothetical protein